MPWSSLFLFFFVFLSQAWQVRCEMREISSFMPLYALLIYYDDNNKYYEWRRLTQERECVVNKTSSPHVMAASRYTRYTTHVIIYTYTYVCAKSLILTFFFFAFRLFFLFFFYEACLAINLFEELWCVQQWCVQQHGRLIITASGHHQRMNGR